ncbi:MAG: 4Fe-4S dicluster domain-containing protein [Parasporobacterium sp.]|nr:4Fe-4S dicluster domain-containing protein [Parasporobacterium sp.]
MSYKINFYADLCVACGACSVACMDQNDIDTEKGDQPYRRAYQTDYTDSGEKHIGYFSASCRHCDDAPCIAACPSGCLFKDPETGFTVYDTTNCIGCRSCSMACPHGAPAVASTGKMAKCYGCNERVKAGLKPACVAVCPFGALKLEEA